MPQITAYLRVEDIELWKAVPSKAQFLHDALNRSARVDAPAAGLLGTLEEKENVSREKYLNKPVPFARMTSVKERAAGMGESITVGDSNTPDELVEEMMKDQTENFKKPSFCKQHNCPKEVCRMMKH